MDYGFWSNLFESVKERRNVMVFFGTLVVLPGMILLASFAYYAIEAFNLADNWPVALAGFGLIFAAVIWRGIRQRRARKLNRYKISPLSRDELTKARSKLTTKPIARKL
jgi:hypothetical protein